MPKVSLLFEMQLDIEDTSYIREFGEDMSVFLEEYLNGGQLVDIEFKGHKIL